MNYDKIVNPISGTLTEKYSKTWYYLIRKGYNEPYLESLPCKHITKPIVTKVKNINLDCIMPSRGGVILYKLINGLLYFGFGVDRKYAELTDFAGGISYKKDKNAITGSLRELKEETLGLYNVKEEDVQESVVIYDKHNLVLFLRVDDEPSNIIKDFKERYTYCFKSEITDIIWVNELSLNLIIKYSKHLKGKTIMYERLRNLLEKADNFYKFL